MYNYKALITEVVDGDTVTAIVDLGFGISMTDRFRLYGINAPEMRLETKAAGQAAKARLTELVFQKQVMIITYKDKKEKYGRYLATINLPGDSVSVNDRMVQEGHAIPYLI